MDDRLFGALLRRALAVPVGTLLLIAVLLGLAVRRLERSAQMVDYADLVIADATLLNRLMIDQETGLRGYVAYGEPQFLDPYRKATPRIATEFDSLFQLVSGEAEQIQRLARIRSLYADWRAVAERELQTKGTVAEALGRKRLMDQVRAELESLVSAEQSLRAARASTLVRYADAVYGIGFAVFLVAALLIGLYTQSAMQRILAAYREQMAGVTEQRAAAMASEAWLRTTLRSIGDAVIASDQDGRVVFMNMVAERLTGWHSHEAQGRSLNEVFRIVNETSRAVVEGPVDKVRRLGMVVGLANHTVLIRRDGLETHIDDSGAPILNEAGVLTGVVLIFRDINERRQAEAALMQAEKLASAGRLSAAIAHEVNNPLEALTNLLYIAKHDVDQPHVRHSLEQAEHEVSRIAHITRQSLGFYREDTRLAIFSVSSVINQTITFYTARASLKGVLLRTTIESDVDLLGSGGELRQVLSNLLSNSLDACEAGGSIRVSLRKHRASGTGVVGARIVIADSGCGIDPAKLAAIFEPFYTTKGSTGTGLGLWVTRQLIEKHGGSIRVRSANAGAKRGTIFRIFLPSVNREIRAASAMTGEGLITA